MIASRLKLHGNFLELHPTKFTHLTPQPLVLPMQLDPLKEEFYALATAHLCTWSSYLEQIFLSAKLVQVQNPSLSWFHWNGWEKIMQLVVFMMFWTLDIERFETQLHYSSWLS